MKKILIPALLTTLIFSSCAEEKKYSCIAPLPAPYSIETLTDATVLASFSLEDFSWTESKLAMSVYCVDLYDAVELSQISVGDTLVYNGSKIVVEDVSTNNESGEITINNGLYEGGANLIPECGGTYRAIIENDYATYTYIGKTTLPLLPDFTLVNCGEDFHDPSDTITSAHKEYIESASDIFFNCLNTNVRIENGNIANITRRWIP